MEGQEERQMRAADARSAIAPPLEVFDARETAHRLPFETLIPALERGFAETGEAPRRHHHTFSEEGATLLLMPYWRIGEQLGVKLVNVVPANAGRGLPTVQATYLLADAVTGRWLAIMDGGEITSRRTAAASALAASFLARPDSSRMALVGAGQVARMLPYAYRAVLPLASVSVWDIDGGRAAALVEALRQDGFDAVRAPDLRDAVRHADIVSCATLSREPLVAGSWLRPGTHVDLIGGFTADMREVDDDAVRLASVFVDTPEAFEAGDLAGPMRKGWVDPAATPTLGALCRKAVTGRRSAEQITLFKSVGDALEDFVSARLVYGAPR